MVDPSSLGGLANGPAMRAALDALAREVAGGTGLDLAADVLIAEIDARIAAQLDEILHAPPFQRLEAGWRGLAFVAERTDPAENIAIAIWNVTQQELAEDFDTAPAITRTACFRWIYTEEYGQYGGTPYAAILVDHAFGPGVVDTAVLRALAAIGAMALAPVFVSASPSLLGVRTFEDVAALRDLSALHDDPRLGRFRALRELEDARYLGVLLPRVLLRPAWRVLVRETPYEERVDATDHALFGSAIYAWATRLVSAFVRERWCFDIVGSAGGKVDLPARPSSQTLGTGFPLPAVDVLLTERVEVALASLGFVCLCPDGADGGAVFVSAPTVRRPGRFGDTTAGRGATLDDALGAQFPYLFIACRIAHYVKVLQRDLLGGAASVRDVQASLNAWISDLVVDMNTVSPALRARYPLRKAQIHVVEAEGQPGWFRTELKIQPHLRYMGAAVSLSIQSRAEGPTTRRP